MNYEHDWVAVEHDEKIDAVCDTCNRGRLKAEVLVADPCPEKIVQEVVRRLGVELQKANIVPAKRRHQPR